MKSVKSNNSNLGNAKKEKNDEFYTQLSDIENELKHYKKHFKDKVVYCNCDDPEWSNFWIYFSRNFEHLGLKKLISTHYSKDKPSFKLEIQRDINSDNKINHLDTIKTELKQNGDFRSDECIELLKEADIIVSNPPFSLFREYVNQLITYNKRFLILGNNNALTYKDIFTLLKNNKLWLGVSSNKTMEFELSDGYSKWDRIGKDGKKYGKVPAISWFTNLEIQKRHEELILYKNYTSKEYPYYENYNAINVDKTKDIPIDYFEPIGVPITFMDKYNPEQFEIIALGITGSIDFISNKKMEIIKKGELTGKFTFNAKGTLYRKYNPLTDESPAFKDCENGELYSSIYARIIIKRIKKENI